MSFPWRCLPRPLAAADRRRLSAALQALVRWQRDLRAWPAPAAAPDADPFVSLSVGGVLRGCFGSSEGAPGERLARAFLLAAGDARFSPIVEDERRRVRAQVSYARRPLAVTRAEALARLEIGTHGVAVALPDGRRAALLPDVARRHGWSAPQLIAGAEAKLGAAGPHALRRARHFLFEAESVGSEPEARQPPADTTDAALAWLARQIDGKGRVGFGFDPRAGRALPRGLMFHARSAAAIEALDRYDIHRRKVERARSWLGGEIAAALRGGQVEGWPDTAAMVAGTLALAIRAGVPVRDQLLALARSAPAIAATPWHAGQVVAALGPAAPPALWTACVRALDGEPIAPWSLLGARATGDRAAVARCEAALAGSVRARGPHVGAVLGAAVPELALTAMTVAALRGSRSAGARRAVARGVAFLKRWQELPSGAFPLSPVHAVLRTDVTAHALLALHPGGAGARQTA